MNETPPPSILFMLSFWLERSLSGARWRGSIEHIPSGRRRMFLKQEEMLDFIHAFNIFLADRDGRGARAKEENEE